MVGVKPPNQYSITSYGKLKSWFFLNVRKNWVNFSIKVKKKLRLFKGKFVHQTSLVGDFMRYSILPNQLFQHENFLANFHFLNITENEKNLDSMIPFTKQFQKKFFLVLLFCFNSVPMTNVFLYAFICSNPSKGSYQYNNFLLANIMLFSSFLVNLVEN